MSPPPSLTGYHHITINVQDPEKSARWYSDVLGFAPLTTYRTAEFDRVILRHPTAGMTLGLNRHAAPQAADPFDERRAGLDHIAFQVPNRDVLEEWAEHLDRLNVPHSEVKPAAVPGAFLMVFRDADNTQLEAFAPPTA